MVGVVGSVGVVGVVGVVVLAVILVVTLHAIDLDAILDGHELLEAGLETNSLPVRTTPVQVPTAFAVYEIVMVPVADWFVV